MPYAPGITYDTSSIGQGIANLGQNLRGALEQYRREKQEGQFLDTQFESLAQAVAAANPDRAPELAKFSGMSLGQKRGKLAGLAFEVDQMRKQQDQKLRERGMAIGEGNLKLAQEAASENRLLRADQQRRAEEERAGQKAFAGELAAMAQGGPLADGFREPDQPLSLADVVKAAGRSGVALPAGSLMEAVRMMQADRDKAAPRAVDIGGRPAVFSPATGAFSMLPPEDLTPAQKQSAIRDLRRQWTEAVTARAKDVTGGSHQMIDGLLDSLAEGFKEFGIEPPKRATADPAPSKSDATKGGSRFKYDAKGNLVTQ